MIDIMKEDRALRKTSQDAKSPKSRTRNKKIATPDSPSSNRSLSVPDEFWIDKEDSKSTKNKRSPRQSRRENGPANEMEAKDDKERRKAQRESHKAAFVDVLQRAESSKSLQESQEDTRGRKTSKPKRRSSMGALSGKGETSGRRGTDSSNIRRRNSSLGPVRRRRSHDEYQSDEENSGRSRRSSRIDDDKDVEGEERRSRRTSNVDSSNVRRRNSSLGGLRRLKGQDEHKPDDESSIRSRRSIRTDRKANRVLERANSGKSLKELATESRRRRSNSIGAQSRRRSRSSSAKPKRVVSNEGTVKHSKRLSAIEAQIKAEEEALFTK